MHPTDVIMELDAPAEQPPPQRPKRAKKGPPEIRIKVSWCKSCGLCVDHCNRGVLVMKNELPAVVHADRCTRCMICEAMCPDFAIQVAEPEDAGGGSQ